MQTEKILYNLMLCAYGNMGIFCKYRCPKPGQAYLKLSKSTREIMKQLKSDDIKNIRVDAIFGDIKKYKLEDRV